MRDNPLGPPVWRGERGRTEVWYATFTDAATGLGVWIHAETVAPTDDRAPYAHGWVALFPVEGPPTVERFGPAPIDPVRGPAWFRVGDVEIAEGVLRGSSDTITWDLRFSKEAPTLFTFPRMVWERHLLPGAQIVPWPASRITGSLHVVGARSEVDATGAIARIFGHGSAERWGWLHAPLEGGGVVEIVTATARRAGLRRLRPLAMVQVRLPGEPDWPSNPAVASLRFRTELRADGFTVTGTSAGERLHVDVALPADQSVSLLYTDPDGSTATCTNSERASATVTVRGPRSERTWHLDGTAHAEVGTRPG